MKKITIFLVILGAVLITANTFLLYSLNVRFDRISSKLDQLEAQSARAQSRVNTQNNVQSNAAVNQKEVFTPLELAKYLNIPMDKVYDMIDSPGVGLPYVCVDGEYRFGREAINDWLKRNTDESISN
jgi:excisionase family DNA binding protein